MPEQSGNVFACYAGSRWGVEPCISFKQQDFSYDHTISQTEECRFQLVVAAQVRPLAGIPQVLDQRIARCISISMVSSAVLPETSACLAMAAMAVAIFSLCSVGSACATLMVSAPIALTMAFMVSALAINFSWVMSALLGVVGNGVAAAIVTKVGAGTFFIVGLRGLVG